MADHSPVGLITAKAERALTEPHVEPGNACALPVLGEEEKRVRRSCFQVDLITLQFTFDQFLCTNTTNLIHSLYSQLESVTLVDVVLDRLADLPALHNAVRFEAFMQVHDQLGAAIAVLGVEDVGHLR